MSSVKHDTGKTRWNLLFQCWKELGYVAEVLQYGAKKYGELNWQSTSEKDEAEQDVWKARLWDAALRHMVERFKGEIIDPESGFPHTTHAICNMLFLAWYDNLEKKGSDDESE